MYSGGVDSFLTYQFLRNITNISDNMNLLYFNLGARCNNSEMELFNSDNFKKHVIFPVMISDALNMASMETESAYIPNRNILTAIMTNSVCDSDRIWIGGSLSDRVNDNNKEVFDKLNDLLSTMHKKEIVIKSPFWNDHKCDVVKDYVLTNGWKHYNNQQESRKSLIESTFSCYNPLNECQEVTALVTEETVTYETKECLQCPACFRKCMSLYSGEIFIPMKNNTDANEIIEHYKEEAEREVEKKDIMYPRYVATLAYCNRYKQYMN